MTDYLAVVNEIIKEHQGIISYVKLVGDSIGDQEALSSLENVRPDWIPGREDITHEKQNKLSQTLSILSEGLKKHFAKEEKSLPPILGKFLMRALLIEHGEINKALKETRSIAAHTVLEGLSREDLIARETKVQQSVNDLLSMIEEHAGKEEVMLEMVQRTLEEKR